jgi:uncharacterized tellurite resistance protein B-like protein|tara:strand:- start:408 stop:1220 length:813 start_codon:yes stop_codon:yes gene_type:complete
VKWIFILILVWWAISSLFKTQSRHDAASVQRSKASAAAKKGWETRKKNQARRAALEPIKGRTVDGDDDNGPIKAMLLLVVAMADGDLDDREGKLLQKWVTKEIDQFSGDKREKKKNLYNESMTRAYEAAQSGDLILEHLTEELNETAEKSTRYEIIELCFDMMAADGVVEAAELQVIRKIARALNLDFDEIKKIQDHKISGDTLLSHRASIEELLEIDPDWDTARKKRHLSDEYNIWNNRLNTLPEGGERENAQQMLNLISEARAQYDRA